MYILFFLKKFLFFLCYFFLCIFVVFINLAFAEKEKYTPNELIILYESEESENVTSNLGDDPNIINSEYNYFSEYGLSNEYNIKIELNKEEIRNNISQLLGSLQLQHGESVDLADNVNTVNSGGSNNKITFTQLHSSIPIDLVDIGNLSAEKALHSLRGLQGVKYASLNYIIEEENPLIENVNKDKEKFLFSEKYITQKRNNKDVKSVVAGNIYDNDFDLYFNSSCKDLDVSSIPLSDPCLLYSWHLQQGGVDAAFQYLDTLNSRTYSSPIVAVIDSNGYSSVDGLSGDLIWDGSDCDLTTFNLTNEQVDEGCPYGGYDIFEKDNDPRKNNTNETFSNLFHGDLVSHIAFSERGNGLFSYGTSYNGRLMYIKVSNGLGISTSNYIQAIDFAVKNGAEIINMSFGSLITCETRSSNPFLNKPVCDGVQNQIIYEIIKKFEDVLFVISAGNEGKELGPESSPPVGKKTYYSSFAIFIKETILPVIKISFSGFFELVENKYLKLDNVFVVGGSDRTHNIYSNSNYGKYVSSLAPGVNVKIPHMSFSEGEVNSFLSVSGTSFSAPFVSGLASTLLSINPDLSPAEIIKNIRNTSQKNNFLSTYSLSGGYVNAFCSVRNVILEGNNNNTELLPPYNFSLVTINSLSGNFFYLPQEYINPNVTINVDSEFILSTQSDIGTKVTYTFTKNLDNSVVRTYEVDGDGEGCEKIIRISDLPIGSWSVTSHTSLDNVDSEKTNPININVSSSIPAVAYKKNILSNNITIDAIAEDNIVNSLEKSQGVIITGTVDEGVEVNITWGDNTNLARVNGTIYSATFSTEDIPADNPFSKVLVRTSKGSVFSDYAVRVVNIDTSAPVITEPLSFNNETNLDGSVYISGDLIVNEELLETPSVNVGGNNIMSVEKSEVFSFLDGISFGDDGGALISPTDIDVSGDYAYVVDSSTNSFLIFNISDKSNISFLSKISDGDGGAILEYPFSINVSGNYAYIASNNSIEIINISNPALPIHTSNIKDGETFALKSVNKIEISGNYLFAASYLSNAIEVIDISNPSSPVSVKTFSSSGGIGTFFGVYDFEINGDYLYAVSQYSNTLDVIKISTLQIVSHIIKGRPILMDSPRGITISENYAYIVSKNSRSLQIIDISDPSAPIHSGNIAASSDDEDFLINVEDVVVYGNFAYISTSSGINIFNVADKMSPVFIENIVTPNITTDLEQFKKIRLVDSTLYAPHIGSIYILNVLDGNNVVDLGVISERTSIALLSPINFAVDGDYAYITSPSLNILEIVDISDPMNLQHISFIRSSNDNQMLNPRQVRVRGDYAYVISKDSFSLNIIDISDPENPFFFGKISDPVRFFNLRSFVLNGNYAYVISDIKISGTDLSTSIEIGRNIEIIDISNPASPTYVKSIQNGELGLDFLSPTYLDIVGDYLYIGSRGSGKVQILSIVDPLNPVFVGEVLSTIKTVDSNVADNIKTVHEFTINENFLYILSRKALTIVDISNPRSPLTRGVLHGETLTEEGYLLTLSYPPLPQSIQVKDKVAYIAVNLPNRIVAIDVSNPDNPKSVGSIKPSGSSPSLLSPVSIFLDKNTLYVASFGSHSLESFSVNPITYSFEKTFVESDIFIDNLDYENFNIKDIAGNTREIADLFINLDKSIFNFDRSGSEEGIDIGINDGLIFILSIVDNSISPSILSGLVSGDNKINKIEHIVNIQNDIKEVINSNYDITKNGLITVNDGLIFILSIGDSAINPIILSDLLDGREVYQDLELIKNLQSSIK